MSPKAKAAPSPLEQLERTVVACYRCPELREYCSRVAAEKKREYRDLPYWGKPVPGWGDPNAPLLLVGLAPGAHGSNRTGRPFTGDASGLWLYRALFRAGFANQAESIDRDDGLELREAFITASIRCAPPQNKPTPDQRKQCFSYLEREYELLRPNTVVTLGKIADDTVHAMLRKDHRYVTPRAPFKHGAESVVEAPDGRLVTVLASYHPSRQNTNTGVLTEPMLDAIFTRARTLIAAKPGKKRR